MKFRPDQEYLHELVDMETYLEIAKWEKNEEVKELLNRLAQVESGHAAFWKALAEKRGMKTKRPELRLRLLSRGYALFRRLFGLVLTVKLLEMHESEAIREYSELLGTSKELSEEERTLLKKVIDDEKDHELELINEEVRVNPQGVRDVIYGISDALVEVLAAVSGLAGVLVRPLLVALGGLIVGASGTLSMGAGAYVSSESEQEVEQKDADETTNRRGRSALRSALTTSASYLVGVFPPTLPYIFGLGGNAGLLASYVASAASLYVVGSLVGIVSGVSPGRKGLQMLTIGIGAALATHGLGLLASYYLHVSIRKEKRVKSGPRRALSTEPSLTKRFFACSTAATTSE